MCAYERGIAVDTDYCGSGGDVPQDLHGPNSLCPSYCNECGGSLSSAAVSDSITVLITVVFVSVTLLVTTFPALA